MSKQEVGHRRGWTLGIVSVGLFMVVLDNLVVSIALPSIHRDLGASIQTLEWTVNAYVLAYAVLLLTGAALGDRFGRKRMFIAGLTLFTVSSAAAALAPSIGLLIAARASQGIGAAIVTPLTLTLLADAFPPERRGLALGVWSGISGIAVALGPLVGGAVIQISLLALDLLDQRADRRGHGAARRGTARSRATARPRTLDLRGLALGSAGLFGIVFGLVQRAVAGLGQRRGDRRRSPPASLLVVAFVLHERRTERADAAARASSPAAASP